ncbi:MAG: hypothetical protein JWN95_293 [Frankiales bacterium]|nr:hypothetical protein [Frankiales bacterium]
MSVTKHRPGPARSREWRQWRRGQSAVCQALDHHLTQTTTPAEPIRGKQTALKITTATGNLVRIVRGEKYTAYAQPNDIVTILDRLEIPFTRDHHRHAWAFPIARLPDLTAYLDHAGRKYEVTP